MKHLKLFMASPNDVSKERSIFSELVNSINRSRANKEGFHFEPILWEDYAYPEADRPQSIINKLLDEADLVIVVFWNKFGVPNDKFPSGTMEEFSLAYRKRISTGSPSIKIYFRKPEAPENLEDIGELKNVFVFKDSLKNTALYKEYNTVEEFRNLINEHINAWFTAYVSPEKKSTKESKNRGSLSDSSKIDDVLGKVFGRLEAKYSSKYEQPILFGLKKLDNALSQLEDANLILIAGEEGVGKTSLITGLANKSALIGKKSILYFSLVSKKLDVVQKILTYESQVKHYCLNNGMINKEEWPALTRAAGDLANASIFIDDNPLLSTQDIREIIRGLVNRCVKDHQAAILSSTFCSDINVPSANCFPL